MSKNIYIEEFSGNFNDFDYLINAEIENTGVTTVSSFLNHKHIHFGHMLRDFKCMLRSLKEHYRNTTYDADVLAVNPDNKEFKVSFNPNEQEVTVILYNPDFDIESLIESFTYAVGYVQSFMIHSCIE